MIHCQWVSLAYKAQLGVRGRKDIPWGAFSVPRAGTGAELPGDTGSRPPPLSLWSWPDSHWFEYFSPDGKEAIFFHHEVSFKGAWCITSILDNTESKLSTSHRMKTEHSKLWWRHLPGTPLKPQAAEHQEPLSRYPVSPPPPEAPETIMHKYNKGMECIVQGNSVKTTVQL